MNKLFIVSIAILFFSCETTSDRTVFPTEPQDGIPESLAKKGGNDKGKERIIYTIDIIPMKGTPLDNNLINNCPETRTERGYYNINWEGLTQCVILKPYTDGVASVTLTQDPQLWVKVKQGKIIGVYFFQQDVDGPEGIQYSFKTVELKSPVIPDASGFTLQVQRDDIEVWKHKTHNGGARVEMVGTICIGDIVYTPVAP
jgi:hypothetical protein